MPNKNRWVRRALITVIATSLFVAAVYVAYSLMLRSEMARLHEQSQHRLDILVASLQGELARFQYLPQLLDTSSKVTRLFDLPNDESSLDEANHYLHAVNETAGSTTLYVLNPEGDCLAASDWNEPGTPFKTNLAFRPYMQAALTSGRGSFYGVGFTSGRPGYYLSYALYQKQRLRGVATVKISLEGIEKSWRQQATGNVILLDRRGVVILSSQDDWRYRPVTQLTAQQSAEVAKERPYGKATLLPLDWKPVTVFAADAQTVRIAGNDSLLTRRNLPEYGWEVWVLSDTVSAEAAARNAALLAALIVAVIALLAATQWLRQRALRHKLANERALQLAYDSLEDKVAERTTELTASNAHLEQEVAARKAVQAHLVKVQSEKIHAGKMVALGQMSAVVVHELNQPLAALRTLSDNACVLLNQDRLSEAQGNLQRIGQLVDRLGRVTYQLKAFAHKDSQPIGLVEVQTLITNAQFVVAQRLNQQGVEISVAVSPADMTVQVDPGRLEQVLVNLFGNAIDAVSTAKRRNVSVDARVINERCVISVVDTGLGIRADILPHLFEAFTTSKAAGSGLGLGLMISAHIVADFGGQLTAQNLDEGGACFSVDLPLRSRNPSPGQSL